METSATEGSDFSLDLSGINDSFLATSSTPTEASNSQPGTTEEGGGSTSSPFFLDNNFTSSEGGGGNEGESLSITPLLSRANSTSSSLGNLVNSNSDSSSSNVNQTPMTATAASEPLGPPPDLLEKSALDSAPATPQQQPIPMPAEISMSSTSQAMQQQQQVQRLQQQQMLLQQQQFERQLQRQKMFQMQQQQAAAGGSKKSATEASPVMAQPMVFTDRTSQVTWQAESDMPHRRKMIAKIVQLLEQRKPNAPNEWIMKLPDMARRLEDSLYRKADSLEDYSDLGTLKKRLQQLAVTMGVKSDASKQAGASAKAPVTSSGMNAQKQQQLLQQQQRQQQQMMMQSQMGGAMPAYGYQGGNQMMQQGMMQGQNFSGTPQQQQLYMQQMQNQQRMQAAAGMPYNMQPSSQQPTVEQRQNVLRQQQQRLLLLRHASKCPAAEGTCKVTPNCASMKKLWAHIAECKDQACKVSHCVSSRFVLSHYHQCKDQRCKVCGPVRAAIQQRSQEAPKSFQAPSSSAPNNAQQANSQQQAAVAQQRAQLMQAIQAIQARAAGLPLPQLITQAQAARAGIQTATQQTQALVSRAQQAAIAAKNASPRSSAQRIQEANAARNQALAAKQKLHQYQLHYQAYASLAKRMQGNANAAQQQQIAAAQYQGQQQASAAPLSMPSDLSSASSSVNNSISESDRNAAQKAKGDNRKKVQSSRADADSTASLKRKVAIKQEKAVVVKSEPGSASSGPKCATEGTSLISQFTNEQLEAHLKSLQQGFCSNDTILQLKNKLGPLLRKLMDHEFGWVFNSAVDPVALGIPDYFTIVKQPMDLGTVKKRLESGYYKHYDYFADHVRRTFNNAILYNEETSDVHKLARDLLDQFNKEYDVVRSEIETEEMKHRERENACRLCGGDRLIFEPLVFYCNGPCGLRIRRNSYFYACPENKYHWCQPCFNDLKKDGIQAGDKQLAKSDLTKKKNDEVNEEPWVQCDHCNKWVHQLCVLFNGRSSDSKGGKTSDPFYCPICLLELRKKSPKKVPIRSPTLGSKDLQRTKLSDFLEVRVQKALEEQRQKDATLANKPLLDIPTAEGIVIRQVSNIERQLMVRDKMFERYKASHGFPAEFHYKSKCMLMFQKLDGVSTLLFGMYVHEYDEKEPEPNSRRVYVSYLDSVHFFQPRHLRTVVYHEILISYLDYVKNRGFHTAHIWACPPLKGDDYILYCHPEDQRTPKSERLRQWYLTMLLEAQKRGIALEIGNLYAEFWRNGNGANVLPYFEGDYLVGVAEEFAKDIEEDQKNKKNTKKKAPNSTKGKKKNSKKGSSGKDSNSAEDESNDELMVKLGSVIEPMKDDFLVVKLHPYCQVCRKTILKGNRWSDPDSKTGEGLNPEELEYNLCDDCYTKEKSKPRKEQHPVGKDAVVELVKREVNIPEKCTDPDEVIECEFFDTRQSFLSLCQGNHYQFDQLRRAKHTSLMVLYHLHNPLAPAYPYVCNICQADITVGNRWHCEQCNEYDLCDKCYKETKHEHPLKAIVARDTSKEDNAKARKARQDRVRSIQLHMQLLVHASGCNNAACPSANCPRMKDLLKHGSTCPTRATGGCPTCRRVWALLQIHARQCRTENCPVPRCKDLKEHLRRQQRQQQQMDDRRRVAFTEAHRQQSSVENKSSSAVTTTPSSVARGPAASHKGQKVKGGAIKK